MNQNEHNRVVLLSEQINVMGDPRCGSIVEQSAVAARDGNIRMWTEGSTSYNPNDYYGDRHNAVNVTHLTANAFASNYELMRTLIHEAAHAIGVTDDDEALELEYACMGNFET